MNNLTRDPFHELAGSTYCQNMNKLTIKVDGVKLDSKLVLNVYRVTHNRKPYVQMMRLDDQGKILSNDGKPVTDDFEGEIELTGVPSRCGCWKGRRVANWWNRISDRPNSW